MQKEHPDYEEWFDYPWIHHGLPSKTSVAQIWHFEPERKRTLPVFIRISFIPNGILPDATPSILMKNKLNRTVASTTKNAKESARAELVAKRYYGCAVEHFYYAPHEGDAKAFLQTLQDKKITITNELAIDPTWNYYETQLFPTMLQYQSVQNRIQIEKMQKSGDKIEAPRRINHYLSFPNQEMRSQFMLLLRSQSYAIKDEFYQPDQPLPHGLCIRNIGPIDYASFDSYMQTLIPMTESCKGEYQYWDCPIVR